MSDLAHLEKITANLDEYIQQRAEASAAPRIAEAKEAADRRIRGLEYDLKVSEERRDHLARELRRVGASEPGAWDRLKSEIPRLLGRERVEDLPHDSEYATALHDVLATMKSIESGRVLAGEES